MDTEHSIIISGHTFEPYTPGHHLLEITEQIMRSGIIHRADMEGLAREFLRLRPANAETILLGKLCRALSYASRAFGDMPSGLDELTE
jgi:hypothetical protein